VKTVGLVILVGISIATIILVLIQSPVASANHVVINIVKYNGENDFLVKLSQYRNLTVTIDRYNISAFVADTDDKRSIGLSGVENMLSFQTGILDERDDVSPRHNLVGFQLQCNTYRKETSAVYFCSLLFGLLSFK